MNTAPSKSQWKPWHKKVMWVMSGIVILLLWIIISADNKQAAALAADPVASRQKKIDDGFSPWDGSHRKLTALVKQNMNDPKSFEYVDGKYWDMDSVIVVNMRYRGNNAFGGKVMESIRATCSIDGDVIEIIK